MGEIKSLNVKFLGMLVLAFIFSLGIRYIWLDNFNNVDSFIWNNEVMINTNDGYYYAEGARDILNGTHQENDLSPISSPLSKLTAFIASILPVSLETLILWMPGVFGSLLVIPIMLIGRVIKQDLLGFCAALLGSIAWSYYNRTMIGYYDTDLLIVVIPTFIIWGTIYAFSSQSSKALIYAPLFTVIGINWHLGLVHVSNGVFVMALLYTLIYERKNFYHYKFLAIFILALTTLPMIIKLLSIIGLTVAFHILKDKLSEKTIIGIVVVSLIAYLIFGGFQWIMSILQNAYITRLFASDIDVNSLKFFSVVATVREAGSIPFETFANRISGHTITFILSVIGYLFLVVRHRLLIISLPMVVLGFFALQGGLRFTVFAVPFMALGIMYLVFFVAKYLELLFADNIKIFAKYIFVSIATITILYPNVKHVQAYKVPVVFQKNEVAVLDGLKKIANREDYVISWWDYGYPIRYYSDVKTIIDGAKHSGVSNFPVSFALTNSQTAAANMARLDVEFTELGYKTKCGNSMACLLKEYKVKNINDFLLSLNNKNIQKPQKTRDVYFYLPNRMLDIFPTVDKFSNIDLMTGQSKRNPFFYLSRNFKDNGSTINLGNNILLHKQGGMIQFGNQKIPLQFFAVTEYDNKGKLQKAIQRLNPNGQISIIYMKNYKQFLVLDNRMFASSFIQLFALENYDKELFEPVILTPLAKVYKLKI